MSFPFPLPPSLILQVRKKQQHILDVLTSLKIQHEVVDVLDPRNDERLKFMHANATVQKGKRKAVPPQVFNGEEYCGVSKSTDFRNLIKLPERNL